MRAPVFSGLPVRSSRIATSLNRCANDLQYRLSSPRLPRLQGPAWLTRMSPISPPAQKLTEGLSAMRLELPADAQEKLLAYLDLLAKWNRAYNLTAVRDPADMVSRHLLDSLAVLPFVRGKNLADLGSGAGLPGIPLAVARPDILVTLVESNGKKARFMREAAR